MSPISIFLNALRDFKGLVTNVLRKEARKTKMAAKMDRGVLAASDPAMVSTGFQSRSQHACSVRGETVNVLGFSGHIESLLQTILPGCWDTEATAEGTGRNVHVCVPVELCLQKQATGHGLPASSGRGRSWKERRRL